MKFQRLERCRGESCIRPDRKIDNALYALSRFKPVAGYTFNGSRFLVPAFQRGNAYHMGSRAKSMGTRRKATSKSVNQV